MFDLSDPAKVQQQVDAAEPQIDEVIAMIKAGVLRPRFGAISPTAGEEITVSCRIY